MVQILVPPENSGSQRSLNWCHPPSDVWFYHPTLPHSQGPGAHPPALGSISVSPPSGAGSRLPSQERCQGCIRTLDGADTHIPWCWGVPAGRSSILGRRCSSVCFPACSSCAGGAAGLHPWRRWNGRGRGRRPLSPRGGTPVGGPRLDSAPGPRGPPEGKSGRGCPVLSVHLSQGGRLMQCRVPGLTWIC